MISIHEIDFPLDCQVVNHDFHNYEPLDSFNEADSLKYLKEDLLQCTFPEEDVVIDLGWYGDIHANKGEFKILVIQNENWEIPINTLYSKSAKEVRSILTKILEYYTREEHKGALTMDTTR